MSLTSKLTVVVLATFLTHFAFGQKYFVHKKKQSYFGLTGGMNFTIPKVTESYSVLSSVESTNNENSTKVYDKFGMNRGMQFGVRYSYNFTNSLSLVAGFGYQSVRTGYFTDFSWMDTVNNEEINREMHHVQRLSYFTLPVMARWDITASQLMPYVQGGVYMDYRHQARKVIHYDNTIDGEETEGQISSSSEVSITDLTRKFNIGFMAGIGIRYHTKYFTFGIESNFRYGFLKVVNDEMRYTDPNGFTLKYLDVLDQFRLSNLNTQLTVSLPINHSIKLNILRRKSYRK